MDPFIPINVPDYSDKEAYSCIEYFINRRWILNPKGMYVNIALHHRWLPLLNTENSLMTITALLL